MKYLTVNILRGKNQIGENLIEISDKDTKILLECGIALNPTEKTASIEQKITEIEYDAVIITHYHHDHSALLKIPLKTKIIFMGK